MATVNMETVNASLAEVFGEPISIYTRAQAIEDGVLVDVTAPAREAGFRLPVALSRAVWDRLVALPDGYTGWQSENARLWDVLWLAAVSARARPESDRLCYAVRVRDVRKDGTDSARAPRVHHPIMTIGGGDSGEPVVTIMFPEDD